jgi:hypothetical protein
MSTPEEVMCVICHKPTESEMAFRYQPKGRLSSGVRLNNNQWICQDCHEDQLEAAHG